MAHYLKNLDTGDVRMVGCKGTPSIGTRFHKGQGGMVPAKDGPWIVTTQAEYRRVCFGEEPDGACPETAKRTLLEACAVLTASGALDDVDLDVLDEIIDATLRLKGAALRAKRKRIACS